MQIAHECFTTDSDIIELDMLDDGKIALCTKDHGIKFICAKNCHIKFELSNRKINSKLTCITLSPDAQYAAFYSKHHIYILYLPSNLVTQIIPTNNEEVEILSFDESSTYIVAGTANGRVLQYRKDGSILIARLCSFPMQRPIGPYNIPKNYVSALAFHKNKVACTGYDGAIVIIDLITGANKEVISHSRTRIDALCFINDHTIVSGNRDGVIHITILNDKKAYTQLNAPFVNIKQIIAMPDPNYIMIHAQLNYTAIIDIKNINIIDDKYLKFEHNIKKIILINHGLLIVALKNSKILQVRLRNLQDLQKLIKSNSLERAYKLIYEEPMLKNTQGHKELEEKYERIYTQAINALSKQNREFAIQLIDIFKNIPSKQNDIKSLFRTFESYPKYKELFINRKYALFYSMSNKFPQFQKTLEYKKMEEIWKKSFAKAQKEIILGHKDGAKSILNKYITINSKREIIHLMINNNEKFIDFLKAIDEKDFQTAHKLSIQNDLFTKFPSFKTLNIEINDKLQKIKKHINKGDVTSAKELLTKLKGISSINIKVLNLHDKCSAMLRLKGAYSQNDFKSCYEILDRHIYLQNSELGILLEKHFLKLMHKCEKFALNGDIKSIKKSLDGLIKIDTRKEKIGNIFRVSFLTKIESLMQNKNYDGAETIIYTYIDTFGIESEIYTIMKRYEMLASKKLAITQGQTPRFPRDSWIHSKMIIP